MVVLTIIFAVLNICLGFALAMYLGHSLAEFHEARKALDASRVRVIPSTPLSPTSPSLPAGREDKLTGGTPCEPDAEPHHNGAAELLEPSSPENWNLDEKYIETSILRLNIAMMKSDKRTSQIDSRLRTCRGHSERDFIEACLRLLREDCLIYLAEQREAADKFHNRISEFGKLRALSEEIEMTNLEQSAQVETTLNNLEYMDFHTDPEVANLRLLEEIKNLYVARHKLRDNQEAAFLTVARHENRLDKIEKQLFSDHITRLRNRIGLETTLSNWWRQGRHQNQRMIAVLFDINGFGPLNNKFGPVVGDRILYQLAQFLQTSIGKEDMVGRYAGQQFLAMLLDVSSSTALKNADLWRQSIEKIAFLHENKTVRITVSGAVTLVAPSNAYTEVLERLEKIIQQVKLTGPNRIFFHNGTSTTPVESHNLGLPETEIVI